MTDLRTIECDRPLSHAPGIVWRALAEPALLVEWWAKGNIAPVIGHHFVLDMGSFGQQPCTVTRVEPQRLFAYTFAEGSLDSTLTWALEPEGRPPVCSSSIQASTSMIRWGGRHSQEWDQGGPVRSHE